jgi:RNA polymerase sigma-70 factor (ECF subfamily)
VLHEAFGYAFRDVADVLETSEANARQLARRARVHLDRERPASVTEAERRRFVEAFLAAARDGDLEALTKVLAADVVALSDGGGAVLAARKPVAGPARVAAFLLGVLDKFTAGMVMVPVEINGGPAFAGLRDGEIVSVWTIEVGRDGIHRFFNVLNPAKLSRIASAAGHSW